MAAVDVAQAKQIAACKDHQGRCVLAQVLGLGPYEEERNMQNAIKVDFLFDHLMFAVNKGFTWEQVCSVVQFAQDFLEDSKEKSLTQMVKTYQAQSADLFMCLGERSYKMYTDFLFSTFLTHFQLYKFVMANPRQEKIPQVDINILPPIPPQPLSGAKEKSVWNYEHNMEELEEREAELEKQLQMRKQQTEAESNVKRAAGKARVDSARAPFTRESLAEMIQSVMEEYSMSVAKSIVTEIKNVREELEVKLEKTSMPRPAALGPPPRYDPKPPVQLLPKPNAVKPGKTNGKNDKSPKSSTLKTPHGSRASSRASKSSKRQ